MKSSLRHQGQIAALKCGAAVMILVAAFTCGFTAIAYKSVIGFAVCWIVGVIALLVACHYGRQSSTLLDRAFDEEMREITGRSLL